MTRLIPLLLLLFATPVAAGAEEPPATYAAHCARQQRFVHDGQALAYVDEGQGQAVLLLHGVPASFWSFRLVIEELAGRGHRVIAPDLLGFGASDMPEDTGLFEFEARAQRLLALLDELGIERFTLVCHDMGGLVAWEMLAAAPDRVERLVLLNTFAYEAGWCPPVDLGRSQPLSRLVGGMFRDEDHARTLTAAVIAEGFVDRKRCRDPELLEGYYRPIADGAFRAILHFMESFSAIREGLPGYQETLRACDVPALIVWGKHDGVLRHQRLIAQFARDLDVDDREIHVLRHGKHFIQEECAVDVVDRIQGFLDTTEAADPGW